MTLPEEPDGADAPLATALAGRYELVARLGKGACGEVHRARDRVLGREVAIKRIRLDAFVEPVQLDEAKQRFVREARVAAGLRHPNIVTTHDIVSSPQTSFIVMELVEGRTLQSLLADRGRLPPQEAAPLLAQVAAALDHAHANGVVHRDVKPANIMVEPSGHVKVMDFGIAKPETGANLTATGLLMGTPSYMSPEQARGDRVDGRSDLFSLGCVLYESLTGVRPFGADSVTAILVRILTEEPPPVDFAATGLPPALGDVLRRAVAKDPGRRFASGGEMIAALREAGGLAAEATPVPRAARTAGPTTLAGSRLSGALSTVRRAAATAAGLVVSTRRWPWRQLAVAAGALLFVVAGGASLVEWSERPVHRSALVTEEPAGLLGRLFGRQARLRVTLPEGTSLHLALETPLSSETAAAGDAISAETTSAVRVEGIEAVPSGSRLSGHVTRARGAGPAARAEVAVEFDSLGLPDGSRYSLRTRPLTLRASARTKDVLKSGLSDVSAAVEGLFSGRKGRRAPPPAAQPGRDVTLAARASVSVETAEPVAILRPLRP